MHFQELSVEVFCPFLIMIGFLLSCLYILDINPIRCIVYKYFPISYRLPLLSVDGFLCCAGVILHSRVTTAKKMHNIFQNSRKEDFECSYQKEMINVWHGGHVNYADSLIIQYTYWNITGHSANINMYNYVLIFWKIKYFVLPNHKYHRKEWVCQNIFRLIFTELYLALHEIF